MMGFWIVFSALRVYALSGRNQILATVTFLFCCVPFAINTVRPPAHYHSLTLD